MGRIELLFKAADEIAQAVLNNQIPMKEKVLDKCAPELDYVTWPQSWFRYAVGWSIQDKIQAGLVAGPYLTIEQAKEITNDGNIILKLEPNKSPVIIRHWDEQLGIWRRTSHDPKP